ncbi:MAG: protein kinase, partial [Caldilineaceae bacterium]|nr:protein kinase [Caldilineaceae bacterium]
LLDFGIARGDFGGREAQTHALQFGTMGYMAPECLVGQPASHRADVYALGVVIYQMLAGEAPFVRTTPVATAHAHVYETPPSLREKRPDLPGSVEAVVAKALAKTPAHRYAETRILAADLAVASTGQIPAGLAATSEPTVPMGHMPGAAQTPAQTDPASEALPPPPPDQDQTVVADEQAPMMSWSAVPVARHEVPPAARPSRPPTVPENEGPSPERLVWGGAGLAVVVALILFVGGLANGSLGAAIAGVFIGVAGVTAAAIAMREIQRRQREARPTTTGLHCVLCGHELRNSVDPCPSCGQRQL